MCCSPVSLCLLRQAVFALRAVSVGLGRDSDAWKVLTAGQQRLMIEIREQYGEEAWAIASEYPYLDHRPA